MAQVRSRHWCCVPQCSNNKQKQPYLSFHAFPRDDERRKAWIRAIRRDEGPLFNVSGSLICSIHFRDGDVLTANASGYKKIKKDAVPCVFPWTTDKPAARKSVYERSAERLGFDDRDVGVELGSCGGEAASMVSVAVALDHDYVRPDAAGALDAALGRIDELEAQASRLTLVNEYRVSKFCLADDGFRYYTRFPTESMFRKFWQVIEPSASVLGYWTKAQRMGSEAAAETGPSPPRKLPLIDEFFLYCMRIAVGLSERVLADISGVSVSTVSHIVITWANYLFQILGSWRIWLTQEEVKRQMPLKFRRFCPDCRVIIGCTELYCETPSALTLHSYTSSAYKSPTTFKGLIGVSPSGTLTFVSKLYSGGISDKEITRQSGIIGLLENGDAVMADKGFLIENLLNTVGAKLIMTPFKHRDQFTRQEIELAQAIASLRIVVERVIRRVKEFRIFDTTLPPTVAGSINQIWTNCCLMVLFQGPMEMDHSGEAAATAVQ